MELRVDPLADPEQVELALRRVRGRRLGMPERQRAITSKEVELAFWHRTPGQKWADAMAAWNAAFAPAGWAYVTVPTFQRDVTQAQRRVHGVRTTEPLALGDDLLEMLEFDED
jgi:hypothetical protein